MRYDGGKPMPGAVMGIGFPLSFISLHSYDSRKDGNARCIRKMPPGAFGNSGIYTAVPKIC